MHVYEFVTFITKSLTFSATQHVLTREYEIDIAGRRAMLISIIPFTSSDSKHQRCSLLLSLGVNRSQKY